MEFVNLDKVNNNLLEKEGGCNNIKYDKKHQNHNAKLKYSRSELKSLIKSPVKAGTKNDMLPCSDCEEVLCSRWSLQKHVKLKHAEKTFLCSVCGKKFIYESNLKDHVKDNHKTKGKGKVKPKPNSKVKSTQKRKN